MVLFGLVAVLALHVRTALALASDNIAVVVQGTSGIAIARCASIVAVRQAISFGHALITVTTHHQSLTGAFTGIEIAAEIVDCSENVARTFLTSVGVL